MPEGTVVGAANGGEAFPIFGPNVFVIKSPDEKWLLVHKSRKMVDTFIKVNTENLISRGQKLFKVGAGDRNFAFSVIKIDDRCKSSQNNGCPYVNPEEYFKEIKQV